MNTTPLKIGAGLCLALFLTLTASAAVSINEDFNAYPGTASDTGWTAAWTTAGSNGSTTTSTIKTTSDWAYATGSYLAGRVNGSGTNAANTQSFASRIVNGSLFDRNESLNVSFLFRPDTAGSSATSSWRFLFNSSTNATGTGPSNLFSLSAATTSGTWKISGYEKGAGDTAVSADSGIALVQGNTYSFSLNINLKDSSFTTTINDLTAKTSFTSSTLYFRTTADVTNFSVQIGALLAISGATTGQSMSFSLDTLSITQGAIPEPSTYAALVGVAGLLAAIAIRRRFCK